MPLPIIAAAGALFKIGAGIVKKIKAKKLAKSLANQKQEIEPLEPLPSKQLPASDLTRQLYGGNLPGVTVTAQRPDQQQIPPWLLPVGLGLGGLILLKSILD